MKFSDFEFEFVLNSVRSVSHIRYATVGISKIERHQYDFLVILKMVYSFI